MKTKLLIMIVLLLGQKVSADFITKDEYARMLYQNPRGIGCDKCHGPHGEGLTLSSFTNKEGKVVEIKAPRIDNIPLKQFYKSFDIKSKLMPVYFLTDDEKAYLYYYLTKTNEKERMTNVN
jgi:hypothetical protein